MILKKMFIACCFFLTTLITAQNTGELIIHVDGIKSYKGYVQIAIYKSSKGFPSKNKFAYKSFRIETSKLKTSSFATSLPFGTYAVAIYQDANANKKLDTNFFGIPKEKTGVSNNTHSNALPSFYQAKFKFLAKKTINISLH
jgi:uncharacterized protein (DUF2141 family)